MRYYGPLAKPGVDIPGHARTYLGQLEARLNTSGQDHGRWRRTMPDGAKLEVGIYPTPTGRHYWVDYTPVGEDEDESRLFLESGYADLVSAYPSGAMYYTSNLEEDSNNQDDIATYLDYLDDVENEQFETRPYTAGMSSISWTDVYTQTGQLKSLNYGCQTGKLLYFWQSGQGSDRSHGLSVLVGDEPSKSLSYGLYTTEAGDYYLLRLIGGSSTTQVSYAKILFTPAGNSLLSYMKDNGYDTRSVRGESTHTSLEGYLFAQANTIEEWTVLGEVECIADPIHYSWNFNWDGDQATIVTHEFISSGTSLVYLTARNYLLTIEEDVDDEGNCYPSSVEVEKAEEINWTPIDEMEFWRGTVNPETGAATSQNWVVRGCSGDFSAFLAVDAPAYSYFDDDGDEIILRTVIDDSEYGVSSLTRLTAWRKLHKCRTLKREFWGVNNHLNLKYYITKDGVEVDGTSLEVIRGTSTGRMEKYNWTEEIGTTSTDCWTYYCAGYILSDVEGYDFGSWPSWSGVPAGTLCNRSDVTCCGYGSNGYMTRVTKRKLTGTSENGTLFPQGSGLFAVFPMHSPEAVYLHSFMQLKYTATRSRISRTGMDTYEPLKNGTGSCPGCSVVSNGPEEIVCNQPMNASMMGDSTRGTCVTHYSYTDPSASYMYYKLDGLIYTRSFMDVLDQTEEDVDFAAFSSDPHPGYTVFFEPAWILCFSPFTSYYSTLVRAQGSAIQNSWLYDGSWADGTYNFKTNLDDEEEKDFLDQNINFTGLWLGRK